MAAAAHGETRARARGLSPNLTNPNASRTLRRRRRNSASSAFGSVPTLVVSTKRRDATALAKLGREKPLGRISFGHLPAIGSQSTGSRSTPRKDFLVPVGPAPTATIGVGANAGLRRPQRAEVF